MGFFSGLRRKVKKLIPKEVRPFIPYAAAMIPGFQGLGAIGGSFTKAALARGLTDDEADLKDVLRAGAFAAAPAALDSGIAGLTKYSGDTGKFKGLSKFLNTAGEGKDAKSFAASAKRFADPKGMDAVKVVGGLGAIDAGIKAAELNEDALAKYNREMAAQGINDKAGRRAAIRAIYEGTGTWDMDEVDGMLDTYGYRTGGRVGYAMGDRVDTEQIIEDFQSLPSIGKGIGNLAGAGLDNIDKIIEMIIKTNPMLAAPNKLIEILVERYGVDPAIAQRKIINRMSDANEGFGPQGLDGNPDEGYNPNIGIDSGAEDYYGETPAMPENLGDMGGNMDDMSGSRSIRRGRGGLDDLIEQMPNLPRPVPMPTPDMPRRPDGREFMPVPFPNEAMPNYEFLNREDYMYGGRAGYKKAGLVSMSDLVEATIRGDDDEEENTKPKRRTRDTDLGENIEMAIDGYNRLYPEIKPASIRPLSFEDG